MYHWKAWVLFRRRVGIKANLQLLYFYINKKKKNFFFLISFKIISTIESLPFENKLFLSYCICFHINHNQGLYIKKEALNFEREYYVNHWVSGAQSKADGKLSAVFMYVLLHKTNIQ